MDGMENSNDIQLVTNQDGTFAGVHQGSGKKKSNKFAHKKGNPEHKEENGSFPPKAKKLFNLD